MSGDVFTLDRVRKRFGATEALRGLSLRVTRGEVYALLGPNGAGKTTAISLLLGLRRPDAGAAALLGRDPRHPRARRSVGVTPQAAGFPSTLRVSELVDLVRAHFPHPAATQELLARFGLGDLARRQAGGLSGGEQRRLAVALAFAGSPACVVLDEPTTGLDVDARRGLWSALRDFAAAGGTVLLTTHYLEEAEALASRVGVLVDGRLVSEGTVAEVRERAGLTRVRLAAEVPATLPGVSRHVCRQGLTTLYAHDAGVVVTALVRLNVPLDGLEVRPASLEEAFVELTGARP